MELRIFNINLAAESFLERIRHYISEGGEYELKLLTVVSDGINDQQLHLNFDVIPVDIGGRHDFKPYGYRIYRSPRDRTPEFLDTHVTILEDDSGIRTVATLMDKVVQTEAYGNLMDLVTSLASNPYVVPISIASGLFQIALKVLKGNSDDLWMQADSSFNKELNEFTGNFTIDNPRLSIDMGFV